MNNLIYNSKRFIRKNSSTILTCIGAIGVAATAIVSAKNTIKAVELLKEKEEPDVKLSKKEIIRTVAPAYIPTALVGISTMACIFGANALNKRTQASLMSAYALLDQSYKEYRSQAKEVFGINADKEIREAVTKLHYNDDTAVEKDDKKVLFFDFNSLQLFSSTMEEVESAEEAVNDLLETRGRVNVNMFYEMLGLQCTYDDYEMGWTLDSCRECGYDDIRFVHEKIKMDDGREVYSITTPCLPIIY